MTEKKARKKKVAASEGVAPGDEPTPSARLLETREKFVPYDLDEFWNGKALWAVNYFVLWPLGLSLVVDIESKEGEVKWATGLEVRHWTYPDGELGETIDQAKSENQADYEKFISFARERLFAMKPDERVIALNRFMDHGLFTLEQLVTAKP